MRAALLALLLAVISAAAYAASLALPSVTFTTAAPPAAYNVGQNLAPGGINYFMNQALYADIMNETSGGNGKWDAPAFNGSAATLDATGAPTVTAETGFTSFYPSGAYTASWTGNGTISCSGSCLMGTITYTSGTNTSTAILTITQQTPSGPTDQSNNTLHAVPPVSNIHILAPASLTYGGVVATPRANGTPATSMYMADDINKLQPFSTIRFMDALNTNFGPGDAGDNPTENWSQRTKPTAGSRGLGGVSGAPQGVAYEDIINMANTSYQYGGNGNKNVWINIPIFATDDYVCRLARLLAFGEQGASDNGSNCSPTAAPGTQDTNPINSSSLIYIEEGNELWNCSTNLVNDLVYWGMRKTGYPGGGCGGAVPSIGTTTPSAILATAVATTAWGNMISADGYAVAGAAAGYMLSYRNYTIFHQVFSQISRTSQIQIVLGIQSGTLTPFQPDKVALDFMNTNYGPLSSWAAAITAAPYFNLVNNSNDTNVNNIFTDLTTKAINNTGPNGVGYTDMMPNVSGNTYGIGNVAYESGSSLGVPDTTAQLETAQTDPRMFGVIQQYLKLWATDTGASSLMVYYAFIEADTNFGYWGSMTTSVNHGSQKYDGLISLIVTPGDINLDGVVNAADCTILQSNYGKTTGMFWRDGDLNHDGGVGADDLTILNTHISGPACTS